MAKSYTVTIPIAGHAIVEVEAEDRESAIDAAFNKMTVEHLDSWEGLSTFTSGNVCHCPSPWEIVVTDDETGQEVES